MTTHETEFLAEIDELIGYVGDHLAAIKNRLPDEPDVALNSVNHARSRLSNIQAVIKEFQKGNEP